MANLYYLIYAKNNKDAEQKVLVQATTVENAWTAVQAADNKARQLVTCTQLGGSSNLIVGS